MKPVIMNDEEHSLGLEGRTLEHRGGSSCEGHTPMEIDKYQPPRSMKTVTTARAYGGRRENKILDPIDRLPLELATFFIQETLPLDGNYAPRLIDLTTVSSKWQRFLFSTPVLWSELYIDETKPDLFATLASCIHLSDKVPLKISVLRPITDWMGLTSVLLPASRRITQLFVSKTSDLPSSNTSNAISCVSAMLRHLRVLPKLKGVTLDGVLELALLAFDWNQLPINTFFTCHLEIEAVHEYDRFFDINRYQSFHASTPPMPSLWARYLSLAMRNNNDEGKATVLDISEGTLAQLRYSTDSIASCGCREQLMCMAADNIQNLEIEIDISQRGDLINCLLILTRLRSLDLTLQPSEAILSRDIVPSGPLSNDLRVMGLDLHWMDEELADLSSVGELFEAFTVLYPRVFHFYFRGSIWPTFSASYLESLTGLKSLVVLAMLGERPTHGTTALSTLEELDLDDPPAIRSIYAPSVLSMTLDNVESNAQLSGLDLHLLRTLTITSPHAAREFEFTLDPIEYPELRDLEIRFQPIWFPRRFVLSSLPQLVSITINSSISFTHPHGSQLCCEILYDPEMCPFLQRLHFDACLEWDILFLMLESRNTGMRKATRIDTVSLPFVPCHLRQPLVHLLAGVKIELPPLVDLSVEETREIICDPTVPGCLFCLANMQPGCQEVVSGRDKVENQDLNEVHPEYGAPPEIAPAVVQQWILRREELISSWIASYEEFQQNFSRLSRCRRELQGSESLYRQYI